MARYRKYDKRNKDYYLSELDERTLQIRAIALRVLTIAAAVAYVPFVALYFVGYRAAAYIAESYDALSAYIALTFALPVALVWCAVFSFLSYTPVREMPARKSPPFGYRAVPYIGLLVALLLSLAFAVYHTVLTALTGGAPSDIGGAVSLWICFAAVAAYYLLAFFTYRASVLIEVETDDDAEAERIILPTYRLTEEEIERGKAEFEPPKEKKKKKTGKENSGGSASDGKTDGDAESDSGSAGKKN